MSTTYVEIIGSVQTESFIKMLLCVPMGNNIGAFCLTLMLCFTISRMLIDMKLVDGTVEMIHKHPQIFMDPPTS